MTYNQGMLRITSHKIAQIESIQPNQLRPDQQWCAVCGTPIVDAAYLDRHGYAGKGVGAILCKEHALAASQSATEPMPEQQNEMPMEGNEMSEPIS